MDVSGTAITSIRKIQHPGPFADPPAPYLYRFPILLEGERPGR